MRKLFLAILTIVVLCSHDMYLKLDTYFLQPNTPATIELYNGTFDKSENVIDRDRMIDVSLIGNGNRTAVNDEQWSEKDSITILDFKTGEAGTWVAGVSTGPRTIKMDAAAFNSYLEHDGVLDMIDWRSENNELENDAVEKYSKHVKTIFQVGEKKSKDWNTILGYPIEFVPQRNPYDLHTGDELEVKLLYKGEPLANQLVYADYKKTTNGHSHDTENEHNHDDEKKHSHDSGDEHSHDAGEEHDHNENSDNDNIQEHSHSDEDGEHVKDHVHTSGTQHRTDENGNLIVKLAADGIWYLRTINLVHSEDSEFTHESNWATLTFEVVHRHDEQSHSHDDAHEEGVSSYFYWIGSLILLLGLFFWFNRKK